MAHIVADIKEPMHLAAGVVVECRLDISCPSSAESAEHPQKQSILDQGQILRFGFG